MQPQSYPILEFDPTREALIEPTRVVQPAKVPERCVLCFFQEVLEAAVAAGRAERIATLRSEIGEHPLRRLMVEGEEVAVLHPGLGGPLSAVLLEEAIALGCRTFVVCGGTGIVNPERVQSRVVVADAAVRDEGTSYHYLPPGREVTVDPEITDAIGRILAARGVPYVVGKTWTTDAVFRETRQRVAQRKAEDCLVVEMEAASLLAVARFRGVRLGLLLYGGDDVSGEEWDPRHGHKRSTVREKLLWLAVEACQVL